MTYSNILIDIAKVILAGVAIVAVAFAFFKPYFERYVRLKHLDYTKAVTERTTPLKLQAYERLILLLDRINPANLVIRLRNDELNAREFEILLVQEIRQEYQHNVTQQLYVSADAWNVVTRIKDDTILMVRKAGSMFDAGERSGEIAKAMLNHLGTLNDDPYAEAAKLLRADLKDLF